MYSDQSQYFCSARCVLSHSKLNLSVFNNGIVTLLNYVVGGCNLQIAKKSELPFFSY